MVEPIATAYFFRFATEWNSSSQPLEDSMALSLADQDQIALAARWMWLNSYEPSNHRRMAAISVAGLTMPVPPAAPERSSRLIAGHAKGDPATVVFSIGEIVVTGSAVAVSGIDSADDTTLVNQASTLFGDGYRFFGAYIGPQRSFDSTEAGQFEAAGFSIVSIHERTSGGQSYSTTDANTDAHDAIYSAYHTVGQPLHSAIYFALELDVNGGVPPTDAAAQQYCAQLSADFASSTFVSNVLGFATTANPYRIGIYGSGSNLNAVQSLQLSNITYYWYDHNFGGISFSSPNIQRDTNGSSFDTDTALTADYGQWGQNTDTTAPSIDTNNTLSVQVGGTATITTSYLRASDPDNTDGELLYVVVSAPTHGSILDNGSSVGSFTQADIDNGRVQYQENGDAASSDSFTFQVFDPAANQTAVTTFGIQISPPILPDLTITTLTVESPVRVGSSFNSFFIITNESSSAAGPFDLKVYISRLPQFDSSAQLGPDITFSALSANASQSGTISTDSSAYDLTPGGYYRILYLNQDKTLAESDYTNDSASAPFLVTAPPRDFNADVKSDILWAQTGGTGFKIWEMNGFKASGSGARNGPAGYNIAGTGDVDGDGRSDILWAQNSGTGVVIWEMNGFQVAHKGGWNGPTGYHIAATGDFNNDGRADILWAQNGGIGAQIWEMDGFKASGGGVLTGPAGYHIAGTGDVDGDGRSDILWAQDSGTGVVIWEMNGFQVAHVGGWNGPAGYHIVPPDNTGDILAVGT